MTNKLREKREASGFNQRELAERSHIPQSTISEIERGVRKPWLKLAKRVSRVLKIPIEDIFPGEFRTGGKSDAI